MPRLSELQRLIRRFGTRVLLLPGTKLAMFAECLGGIKRCALRPVCLPFTLTACIAGLLAVWPHLRLEAEIAAVASSPNGPRVSASRQTGQTGDAACERCHQAIYASYEKTSMALGSGALDGAASLPSSLGRNPGRKPGRDKKEPGLDASALAASSDAAHAPGNILLPGTFLHAPSGIRYSVFMRDGLSWLSYDREPREAPETRQPAVQMFDLQKPGRDQAPSNQSATTTGALHGEHPLSYFIGSGKHGRTYLYQVNGTWFELPINYYTRRHAWDMAPAFDQAATMPAVLPVEPNCLHCHATAVATPLPGSRSHYESAPFAQGGVGCSACHGDPSAHLAGSGHGPNSPMGPIVNPGKLDAARRDSACLSCHLEGDALVFRPGKSLAQFKAGDDLADTAVYFVRASRTSGGGRAASQYEALLRSACKRAAGDRLTCTTCHDPHASPAPSERVAYYRGKCLECHNSVAIATTHHPEQPDCAQCHMPTRATSDISHEQSTDHDIERLPATSASSSEPRTGEALLPVGGWQTSDRELGMAYAQMAAHGDRQAGERALALLKRAEAAGASDAPMHAQLGFLRQISGDRRQAEAEYRAALEQNPYEPSPLANLAVLDATSGKVSGAVSLLERLIAADPSQTAAGLNLAFIECRLGQPAKARVTLATLALYNPDDPGLRTLTEAGIYAGQHCELHADEPTHAMHARE